MFKLNYKQLLSLPVAFVRYSNRSWLCEKIWVWTLPPVTRDSAAGLFVFSFCFIKHRSSHYLLLYAIISFSIYYYWVRFLQLKYTEPLYGQLQAFLDLAFDIRYLYRLVTLSPYLLGFFSHICTIGLYLLYAGKSILVTVEQTTVPTREGVQLAAAKAIETSLEGPALEAAAKFVGLDVGAFQALLTLKGFGPWFESVKNSSAGFFPFSMTSLLHLQCDKDPEMVEPLEAVLSRAPELLKQEVGWCHLPQAVPSAHGYWVSPRVVIWSSWYKNFCRRLVYGMPGKYMSFAYKFQNNGEAPFFGRFTNDLEMMKLLANVSSETFSLFQFFTFSFRTAFRLWIPIFPLGYKDWLAWWIHPYSEISLINLIGQSRYIFEPFMIAVSLVLDKSIQQIYASFYMDQWFFPLYHFLNKWNKLRPATIEETRNAFLNPLSPLDSIGADPRHGLVPEDLTESFPEAGSELIFKPSKFSKFILTVAGYSVKYAVIYVPCEQARIRTQLLIFEILFFRPFVVAFKLLTLSFKILVWIVSDSFLHFIPEVIFDPFFTSF